MDKLDCVIVGGGVAGLTSLVYFLNAKKNVLLFESSAPGGKLNEIYKIKNFPFEKDTSGISLALKLVDSVKSLGGEIRSEEVLDIVKKDNYFKVSTSKNTYLSKFVVLANGTKSTNFGIKGESKFAGKGVSYCATCDGFFFRRKDVAIYGEDLKIIDAVTYLSPLVNKMYVFSSDTLTTNQKEFLLGLNNVELYENESIKEIIGEEVVTKIDSSIGEKNVEGVFLFLKGEPTNSFINKLDIKTTNGYIDVDLNNKASLDGVYAAGDIVNKPIKQIINASSEGMNCAVSIIKKLNESKINS